MKFIPYYNKIVIEPIKQKTVILSDTGNLQERGIVVAIGSAVEFVKIGDHLFFDAWGCGKTSPDEDGKEYYVVSDDPDVILGKEDHATPSE